MINSIYIDVPELVLELDRVSDDPQKAIDWVRRMRDTLVFDGRKESPLPFAIECIVISEGFVAQCAVGKMAATVKKRMRAEGLDPTDTDVQEEMLNAYGDTARDYMAKIDSMKKLKAEMARRKNAFFELDAGGDTREGSQDVTDGSNAALLESGTPAATIEARDAYKGESNTGSTVPAVRPESGTIEADATDREAVDGDHESCNRTTVCDHYDQETTADGDTREDSLNLHDTRMGAALEPRPSANHYGPRQAEARQSLGAGEATPESVSAKTSPALPVLSFGEFGNIKMTDMQYAKLCERFSIADSVLAEADQYFEAQPAKKKKYKNHYAMLLNWCKRRETESTPKKRFKTSEDISRENYEISKRRLDAYFAAKEKKVV